MSLSGLRVFVVDDEALLVMALADMLSGLGCSVVGSALSVEDSLKLAPQLEFDVALLDLNVAGKSIAPVVDHVTRRGIAVIIMSGYENPSTMIAMDGRKPFFLPKPYTLDELRRALSGAVASRAS